MYRNHSKNFFLSNSGDLLHAETLKPIRKGYAHSHETIKNGRELRSTLRAGPYIYGGYEFIYLTSDGGVLCQQAVIENLKEVIHSIRNDIADGWRVMYLMTSDWLQESTLCDHTSRELYPYVDQD